MLFAMNASCPLVKKKEKKKPFLADKGRGFCKAERNSEQVFSALFTAQIRLLGFEIEAAMKKKQNGGYDPKASEPLEARGDSGLDKRSISVSILHAKCDERASHKDRRV